MQLLVVVGLVLVVTLLEGRARVDRRRPHGRRGPTSARQRIGVAWRSVPRWCSCWCRSRALVGRCFRVGSGYKPGQLPASPGPAETTGLFVSPLASVVDSLTYAVAATVAWWWVAAAAVIVVYGRRWSGRATGLALYGPRSAH